MAKKGKPIGFLRYLVAITFIFGMTFTTVAVRAWVGEQEQERARVPEKDPNFQPQLESMYPLEMTDGYFSIKNLWPVHLMHGQVDPQRIWLGNEYSFWAVLALREGAENPCSSRSEEPCRFEFRRVPKSTNYAEMEFKAGLDFRIGSEGWMSFAFDTDVSRKSPLGEVNQVIRVRKGGDILFVYELPLLIVE